MPTAGTNRVCSRCLALKDTVVGYTDESGVTLPPLHPRCRCTIIYDEIGTPQADKPWTSTAASGNVSGGNGFVFDLQRFGGQKLPEDSYNLTVRRQVQNRHIEGTKEYQDYTARLSVAGFKPNKLSSEVDPQLLIREFHGKGIYDPNPKDNSPREKVDTGRIIGQYWDKGLNDFVDTTWLMLVYSKHGTHVYPIRPTEEV